VRRDRLHSIQFTKIKPDRQPVGEFPTAKVWSRRWRGKLYAYAVYLSFGQLLGSCDQAHISC